MDEITEMHVLKYSHMDFQVLLKYQADLENINEEEELPIHVAARCGKTEYNYNCFL